MSVPHRGAPTSRANLIALILSGYVAATYTLAGDPVGVYLLGVEPLNKLEIQRFLEAQRKEHTFHLPTPRTCARILLAYPRLSEEITRQTMEKLVPKRRR